jgi:hypothetical protein
LKIELGFLSLESGVEVLSYLPWSLIVVLSGYSLKNFSADIMDVMMRRGVE